MAMVFPVSTHNYELRYWLAAGKHPSRLLFAERCLRPDRSDVLLSVTPPPQMPATLEAGTINGYSVGEPWNQAGHRSKASACRSITDYEIWKNNPEKVFGVTKALGRKESEHASRAHQVADPRRHLAGCEQRREPQGSGRDPVPARIRRRGLSRHREQHDRHLRVRARRQARRCRTSTCSSGTSRTTRTTATPSGTSRRCAAGARSRRRKPDEWYRDTAKACTGRIFSCRPHAPGEEGKAKQEDFPWDSDGYRPADQDFIDGIDLRRPCAERLYRES